MHVLYVHKNFPAQFGHIAERLIQKHGFRCSFATTSEGGPSGRIERVYYKTRGGASKANHFASRSFENFTWESHAVYEGLRRRPDIRPNVVVGHSGFGSTLFLGELYSCPIVNFCEWFYRDAGSDADFRPIRDQSRDGLGFTRRCRDAMLLADLDACTLGYSPTNWQRSQIPHEYQHKLQTIFDGIETDVWRPLDRRELGKREVAGRKLPKRKRIVTYVSRGFEATRGFDIFMEIARRICVHRSDVVFLCIGSDRVCYGGDLARIQEKSFREHVLKQGQFDLERFIFTGSIPIKELIRAFSFSDLHIYLTVPFILSWSLMNALACGCTVLVSDTAPLREVIEHGRNGLMAPFFDVDRFVELALQVLDDPVAHREDLGQRGLTMIHDRYDLDVVLPQMIKLYERAMTGEIVAHPDAPLTPPGSPFMSNGRHELAGKTDGGVKGESRQCATLRSKYVWPPARDPKPLLPSTWDECLGPSEIRTLRQALPEEAKLILELGAWQGQTTRFLAEVCTESTILAVDTWHGGQFREPEHPNWKRLIPWVWESFVARVGELRGRVIPMRQRLDDAVREVAACGLRPDLVFYDPDYNSLSVRRTLRALVQCFPSTLVLGHDWLWQGVQASLSHVAVQTGRRLVVRGNLWRLEPVARRAKRLSTASEQASTCGCTPIDRGARERAGGRSVLVGMNSYRIADARDAHASAPRVLVTIPHYFRPNSSRLYGSGVDLREHRVEAVRACLNSLYQTLCVHSYTANLTTPENLPANQATAVQLHVVICVSEDYHVLDEIHLPPGACDIRQIDGDPRFLGYACHEILGDRVDEFDYYVYLEDDLVISDPWTLAKLKWFRGMVGECCLLQANRFEVSEKGDFRKAYIDGDLPPEKTLRYQDVSDNSVLNGTFLGSPIQFRRTLNPHAGCFFLSSKQMKTWCEQPYFLDRDASFYSPLEGAATVGIMRTFRVYKPSRQNANFFEIRHMGDNWMRRLAQRDHAVIAANADLDAVPLASFDQKGRVH